MFLTSCFFTMSPIIKIDTRENMMRYVKVRSKLSQSLIRLNHAEHLLRYVCDMHQHNKVSQSVICSLVWNPIFRVGLTSLLLSFLYTEII